MDDDSKKPTSDQNEVDNPETKDISDDEAMQLLAEMDAPVEQTTEDGELSAEEAEALMSEMGSDSPATDNTGDISDDDAEKLLAQMDAPLEQTSAEEMSLDDAQKLLAEMDEPATNNLPSSPIAAVKESAELVNEIDEWEKNDFQTDPAMMDDFITNGEEVMNIMDQKILELEQNPREKELIEEIFRAAHTLKGGAGMFGFRGLERVMHRMETLFDNIRKEKLIPTSETIDVVFSGLDTIKALMEAVKNRAPCGIKTAAIVSILDLAAEGKKADQSALPDTAAQPTLDAQPQPENRASNDPTSSDSKKEATKKPKETSTLRVDLERLDALVNLIGELVIDRTRFNGVEDELRATNPQMKASVMLAETVQHFSRHMNDIQNIVMNLRMVPIGNAFNKYPRIIRDLARSLNKKINLEIIGETAELDKTLVEQIGDPLIHLIRNACDHGIETPEIRVANGKPEVGQVVLSAHQEGNQIIITIKDDGKGIDANIILKKGIEKGLVAADDKLSNTEIFNLIFEPGFSTAEQVTNVSGRGVGMDVVKKQINKLKGYITVDSTLGQGSKIEIRLPLTLAIVKSLIVSAQSEIFAIPLDVVIESIRINPDEIKNVGGTNVIHLRDRVLPIIKLAEVTGLNKNSDSLLAIQGHNRKMDGVIQFSRTTKSQKVFVVVVGSGEKTFGILVDQLMNQQEMVIKNLGPSLQDIPFISGGAVLGNGQVVLVADILELLTTTNHTPLSNDAA